MTKKQKQESHTVAVRGDLRIEILENTDFLAYGLVVPAGSRRKPGTHHVTFIVGGPGIERLYSAQVVPELADGPAADLIDFLLAHINTPQVNFLKRFNVVVR